MKYYKLQIETNSDSKDTFDSISRLLDVHPTKEITDHNYGLWEYEVEQDENGPYYDFVNRFLDLLIPNFKELEKLGIERHDITIWLLYEYDQQCNLEFHPKEMKRLGDTGITLCISCWQE